MDTRRRRRDWPVIALLMAFAATGIAITAAAAQGTPGSQSERSVLDGVFKSSQAERGEQTFKTLCAACHILSDVPVKLRENWVDQTVGDMFDYVTNTMPQTDPGGLKPEEYTDVLAFFLSQSGYPAGDQELPPDKTELLKVRIEALPK